jgi:hypothetical protein
MENARLVRRRIVAKTLLVEVRVVFFLVVLFPRRRLAKELGKVDGEAGVGFGERTYGQAAHDVFWETEFCGVRGRSTQAVVPRIRSR